MAKAAGRKRGGQPGHKPHVRELLPADQVTRVVNVVPKRCRQCSTRLVGVDPAPRRTQVIEVPPVRPDVTEFRDHELCCGNCGAFTRGELPPEAASTFGPRLKAMIALCTGGYRLSKRVTQELLSDFLGVDLALGSVCNIEREVSLALAAPVEAAREHVKKQPVAHADETSWREAKLRAWLWTASTSLVTVFLIAKSRGSEVAKQLLGEAFSGVLVVDRYAGYRWVDLRQLCWAHLKRDVQGFIDRGGVGGEVGKLLREQIHLMFHLWHLLRKKELTRGAFQENMKPVEQAILSLLRDAELRAERKTSGMAHEILGQAEYLFVFVDTEGVEPTNNIAERVIRPAVLWRKGSFGTDSANGSRFAERILTTVATLKQQRRSLLDYLEQACRALASGDEAPSLLPVSERR